MLPLTLLALPVAPSPEKGESTWTMEEPAADGMPAILNATELLAIDASMQLVGGPPLEQKKPTRRRRSRRRRNGRGGGGGASGAAVAATAAASKAAELAVEQQRHWALDATSEAVALSHCRSIGG